MSFKFRFTITIISLILLIFNLSFAVVNSKINFTLVRSDDGYTLTLLTPSNYIYKFDEIKGPLGPSCNPSSDKPFINEDETIFAICMMPATKCCNTYIFLRNNNNEITLIDSVNDKIENLFSKKRNDLCFGFIRIEKIKKNIIHCQTLISGEKLKPYNFKIRVMSNGSLELVK